MLRPLRRRLSRIRYYSARREETLWTRAADGVLFGSLLLALPVVLFCDLTVTRLSLAQEQVGILERTNGGVRARLIDPDLPPNWTTATLGMFSLKVIRERRGWPMLTSTLIHPARLEYDLHDEPAVRVDRGDPQDAAKREAIAEALARGNVNMLESWRSESPARSNEPVLRWLFGAGLWWVFLYLFGALALSGVRLAAIVWSRHERAKVTRLRRTGRCIHCGYDLRGTEFSARCPECGELA